MICFDFRQLEYFLKAADTGSYTQAARELYVTPQAVSRSIQLLEARIGLRLFDRTSTGIVLTGYGQACLPYAREAMKSLVALENVRLGFINSDRTIVLGIHSLCFKENGGSIDRKGLFEFQEKNGADSLSFIEMSGADIIKAVDEGSIDLGVTVPRSEGMEPFERILLKQFSLAALVSHAFSGHFAQSADHVSIKELAKGELVLFTDEVEYNDVLLGQARLAGVTLPVSSLSVSPHGDMGFIADTDLYVIRPLQHARRTVHDERLRILPILDNQGSQIEMPLEIVTKKERALAPLEEGLIAFIKGCYR